MHLFALLSAFLLGLSAVNASALFSEVKKDGVWNDLVRTWGMKQLANNFVSLPRLTEDAISAGWVADKNCTEMNGNRYILNGDRMVMLIFGANGHIAGISAGIPKDVPFGFPSKSIMPFFNDEGDFFSITAYFVDPSTVCNAETVSLGQSTGDRVVIINKVKDVELSMLESNVSSFWTKGRCVVTMGNHYWADVTGKPVDADTDVNDIVPFAAIYNDGKLNAFGWTFNYDSPSLNVEHPPIAALSKTFKDKKMPTGFSDPKQIGQLTTLHVFLDSKPLLNFC